MEAENGIDTQPLQYADLHNLLCTLACLLLGLEDKHYVVATIIVGSYHLGEAQQDGRMPVVTATMSRWQCVDVGAESQRLGILAC